MGTLPTRQRSRRVRILAIGMALAGTVAALAGCGNSGAAVHSTTPSTRLPSPTAATTDIAQRPPTPDPPTLTDPGTLEASPGDDAVAHGPQARWKTALDSATGTIVVTCHITQPGEAVMSAYSVAGGTLLATEHVAVVPEQQEAPDGQEVEFTGGGSVCGSAMNGDFTAWLGTASNGTHTAPALVPASGRGSLSVLGSLPEPSQSFEAAPARHVLVEGVGPDGGIYWAGYRGDDPKTLFVHTPSGKKISLQPKLEIPFYSYDAEDNEISFEFSTDGQWELVFGGDDSGYGTDYISPDTPVAGAAHDPFEGSAVPVFDTLNYLSFNDSLPHTDYFVGDGLLLGSDIYFAAQPPGGGTWDLFVARGIWDPQTGYHHVKPDRIATGLQDSTLLYAGPARHR